MAEGIFKYYWFNAGRRDAIVTSMGVRGLELQPASSLSIKMCAENGIDISAHRSRPLDFEELAGADIVFTMDRVQKEYIQLFSPPCREKTFLLGAWPEKETRSSIIPDPMGASEKVYRKIYASIEKQIVRIVPHVVGMFG
jgi:protein-tyrosine-phosphatase